jgi:GNAT superfamily N-acetyltransferase
VTGRAVPGAGGDLAGLQPGTAVTLRHLVPDTAAPEGSRPVLADVVATVTALGPDRVELRRGDGTSVSVRLDHVTAIRVLPGPPGAGRPVDPLGLARIAAAGWPAVETGWLGDWLLRASGGWTRRANSALVVGAPDRPLAAALDGCRDWYTARGLTPLLSVPLLSVPQLSVPQLPAATRADGPPAASVIAAAGWEPGARTVVLVARSADVLAAVDPPAEPRPAVWLTPEPSAAWVADYRDAATHPAAAAVLAGPPAPARVRFAEFSVDGGAARPAGRGRAVTDQGWVGLSAVGVAPEVRRSGVGRVLVSALLTDGLRHGGVRSYVEVEAVNPGALAFWQRLGYRRSYDCLYYRLPS